MSLALRYEPRLKGCFAWNDFRHRVEVIRKTPWCSPEWWEAANLTPVGHRALRDADMAELGNYLTHTYDFGACAMQASRAAIHAEAEDHIFDELKDWIDALPDWDGVARLDGWLATYAGADPQAHTAEYLALVGSKYIMQVLNRALHPGAKADYSLVFTALQGIGKDRVLEAMFRPTIARASRRRASTRPTLPAASPGRSSRTPPKCRPGAKPTSRSRRRR